MAEFTPQTPMQGLVARTLKDGAGNALSKRSGYTYINGSLIPNAISTLPARAIRAGRIVRAVNEKFVAGHDPKAVQSVTVQLQTNTGVHARTLKNGYESGTDGNDSMINTNAKIIPSTTPFEIPLTQLEDQSLFFPQMQLQTMIFDEVSETIANYLDNVNNGMDSYHMAKALSHAMYRGAKGGTAGSAIGNYANVIQIDTTQMYADTYMIQIVNKINAALANGDPDTQVMTFNGPREIAARPELIGALKTPKTGYILNSDISTKLLMEPNFDIKEAERYGTQYRGNISGYELQEAPQGIWSLVEKWLNLKAGDLDGVLGIIFTPMAYASGGYGKKEIAMLQGTQYDGVVAFPYIKYGGTAYRLMYIIVDKTWSIPAVLQNQNAPAPVKAPNQWYANGLEPIQKVIYDADGNPIGYDTIANILKPNGNDATNVTITIKGTGGIALTDSLVTVSNNAKRIGVLSNGDGTYLFSTPKGSVPSVTIANTGYTSQTFSLTSANTKGDNYMVTKTLVV